MFVDLCRILGVMPQIDATDALLVKLFQRFLLKPDSDAPPRRRFRKP